MSSELVRLDSLFDMTYGHSLELVHLEQVEAPLGVNFVSRTSQNNGVTGRVLVPEGVTPSPPGVLTVAMGGSVLSTFLQESESVSGRDIQILTPKKPMTDAEKLFYCMVIKSNAYRYSYGRQANRTLPGLMVPATPPSWVNDHDPKDALAGTMPFDREHIYTLPHPSRWAEFGLDDMFVESAPASDVAPDLPDVETWREFRFDELFELVKGERIVAKSQEPGETAYVGASNVNNGVTNRFDIEPKHPAGLITVSYNGSVGYATVQPEPFHASDDINVLVPRTPIPELAKFFVCALIREEAKRFSYGRKWNLERMKSSNLRLPVTVDGTPDWASIEAFMAGLRYSSQVEQKSSQPV